MKVSAFILFAALFVFMPAPALAASESSDYMAEMTFTLRTAVAEGKLVYIGQGGDIDGQVNPTLAVPENTLVQINMLNGDGALHDVVAEAFDARSDRVSGEGSSSVMIFRTGKAGEFFYWCSVPGHRAAGMQGRIVVGEPRAEAGAKSLDLTHSPMDLPPTIGARDARHVNVNLETTEKSATWRMARATNSGPSTIRFPAPSYGCGRAIG